jgi:phage/plasmid-associated DNA primase
MPLTFIIPQEEKVKDMDKQEWWAEKGELPGIFNWALVGLARLRTNRQFTFSQVCEDAKNDYKSECNPTATFLLENCRTDPQGRIPADALYKEYQSWASSNGYSPLGNNKFGGEVRRCFRRVERKQIDRKWHYLGISTDLCHFSV